MKLIWNRNLLIFRYIVSRQLHSIIPAQSGGPGYLNRILYDFRSSDDAVITETVETTEMYQLVEDSGWGMPTAEKPEPPPKPDNLSPLPRSNSEESIN